MLAFHIYYVFALASYLMMLFLYMQKGFHHFAVASERIFAREPENDGKQKYATQYSVRTAYSVDNGGIFRRRQTLDKGAQNYARRFWAVIRSNFRSSKNQTPAATAAVKASSKNMYAKLCGLPLKIKKYAIEKMQYAKCWVA